MNIKLRFFRTYNKDGLDSEEELQIWDSDLEYWVTVNHIRVSEKDEYNYQTEYDL